ncbi:MAG: glycosyltransferase family 4 protein [Chloroflexaceae bacterium]|jgi:glycosyltransferase involved in cell wall biosynthesis|nr:glycosyltransferase family 4 protein [Chloroflexaceae bacterium]
MNKPRVLIISHDVVGQHMAGPGIRYWELAVALAAQQPVALVAPQPISRESGRVRCGHFAWGEAASLAPWLAEADVVLANAMVLAAHPELGRLAVPLALDLYDPTMLENLELFRHAPPEQRANQHRHDIANLAAQLRLADFIICATERQRDLYIGALLALGRITPERTDTDARLRGLIDVVPFGLPAEPPVKRQAALRGVLPGVHAGDRVLLWTGGLWDWLDPLTLVRALPLVVPRHPELRLVLLAGQHPGSIQQMQMPHQTRQLATELALQQHVLFYESWVPYEERADLLLEADIAVSLHRDHLETAYAAVRSRFLDHLWAGLPSLVSAGDAAAELVRTHELGLVVEPGDVEGVAAALLTLLDDEARRARCAANAHALAAQFTWQHVAGPLIKFCAEPRKAADGRRETGDGRPFDFAQGRAETGDRRPEAAAVRELAERDQRARANDARRNAVLEALAATHHVKERPLPARPLPLGLLDRLRQLLAHQLVRPLLAPLLEQQNQHNAAVLRALQALAESGDQRRSESYATADMLAGQLAALENRTNALAEATTMRLAELADADTLLAERLAERSGN